MNKREITDRLKEVVEVVEITINNLEHKDNWLRDTVRKVDNLAEHIAEYLEGVINPDEIIETLRNEIIRYELEDCYNVSESLWVDVKAYAETLSDIKQENMLEKYESLKYVTNMLDQDYCQYEDIPLLIEKLYELVDELKEMY